MSASGSDAPAVDGRFHPAQSALSVPARLRRAGDDFEVRPPDDAAAPLARAAAGSVTVSARVGSIPRRLEFPDGAAFVTDDNDGVDRLLPPRRFAIHALERFHPRLLLFAAIAIALLVLGYRNILPVMTEVAVAVTPASAERMIGSQALAVLDRALLDESEADPERRAALAAGFDGFLAGAETDGMSYRLVFRKGGAIGPNAFALPDGTVVLTDELIALSDEDDPILGVLGHEIAHIEHRHSLRRIYHAAGVSAFIMLIGGDVGELMSDILVQGSAVLGLSYSRTQEAEADMRGVELMRAAGRDPLALARMFELLKEECPSCNESSWFSSHPGIDERIEAIRRAAQSGEAERHER